MFFKHCRFHFDELSRTMKRSQTFSYFGKMLILLLRGNLIFLFYESAELNEFSRIEKKKFI